MLYFKNSELAYTYHVSIRTVRNWIDSAKQGKLDLVLTQHGNRSYVSNTAGNIATIERLVEEGKKYIPHRAVKSIKPKPEFYHILTQAQVYDIVKNLEGHHEIPREYNYFDGGAQSWNEYATSLDRQESANLVNMTRKLLANEAPFIDDLMSRYAKINVVDIGVGNAIPVKDLLAHLLEQGKMGRYIAIDISPEMLQIARANIKQWFGNKVTVEDYELDITREGFENILAGDYLKRGKDRTGNLVLFLGGTIQNFRKPDAPLQVINKSMGIDDFLIHTQKLDSEVTRRYFDFNPTRNEPVLPPIHGLIVDMLNITSDFYELELGFDEGLRQRYEKIRFTTAVQLKFEFEEGGERIVNFGKGESILVWRAWRLSALDVIHQFDRNDFSVLQATQANDEEYLMTISRVKRD